MALIRKNADGTFASKCALCGEPLTKPIFATSHFIGDTSHDLYQFSDAAMHWHCYARWPHQARFASMCFDEAVRRSDSERWRQYWTVLLKSVDLLVTYGFAVEEVSIMLRNPALTFASFAASGLSGLIDTGAKNATRGLRFQRLKRRSPRCWE
jgi:hypothetical protein